LQALTFHASFLEPAQNNISAAIILLNRHATFSKTSSAERDLLSTEELETAYRAMDETVDVVVARLQSNPTG
jgi:hypothetical protein